MINFFKTWCENIIVVVIICTIIEMILPDTKNKKYVQVLIGIYIIFTILHPILNKMEKNINFENEFKIDESFEVSGNIYDGEKDIKEIYIMAIKNDIKTEIEKLGFYVKKIELEVDAKYEKIEKLLIYIEENNSLNSKDIVINEINIVDKKVNSLAEKDLENIKNKVLELYEIEKDNIEIKC